MLDSTKRTSMAMLEQLKIDMDNKIEQVNKLSNNIVFNQKLDMIARENQYVFSYNDLMKDMMGYTKSDFIYDYYIYLANTDEIATTTIRINPKDFYNSIYKYEGIEYEQWYKNLHEYHFRDYLPTARINAYESQSKRVITFIQSVPVNRGNILAQAVILIDESMIRNIVDKMQWASGAHIYVLNKKSEVVLTSENAPGMTEDILLAMKSSSGLVDYGQTPANAMITFQTSENSGWKYIMVTPKSTFFTQINRIKTIGYIILIICFIIGSVLAYVFAYRNYRPIKEISDIIKNEYTGYKQPGNELERIKATVLHTLEKKNELKEAISTQIPIMRLGYFTKLMKGFPSGTDTEKDSLSFLQVELLSERFVVMIAEISSNCGFFQSHSEKEWMLARFTLMNVGEELFNKHYRCYFIEIDQKHTAFIVNLPECPDRISEKNEFGNIFKCLNEILCEKCLLTVTYGVSAVHDGIIQLRECYDEALKVLEYSAVKGKGSMIFFEEEEQLLVDRYYYYPIDTEIQIISLLRAGDYEKSIEMIDMVFDINFKLRRISYESGKCLIIEMISTFMKVMNVILAKSGETMPYMDEVVKSVLGYGTIDEMCIKMKEVAGSICTLVKSSSVSSGEKIVNEIIEYIKDNYDDNSLGLVSIAEQFNITPQYVSTIFKRQTSENIKDFISKVRLEKAKELLADNSLTTADIAEKLGYSDERTVIRLFKKYEGMTPGSYRKSIGMEE